MHSVQVSDNIEGPQEGHVTWLLQEGQAIGLCAGFVKVTESHPPHDHPEEQIYYVRSGRGIVRVDDEERQVEKDTLVYIPPGASHSIQPLPGPDALSYVFVTHLCSPK
jgi:mannose-6-phosphate isomerase-like protein (cupin superfamily)